MALVIARNYEWTLTLPRSVCPWVRSLGSGVENIFEVEIQSFGEKKLWVAGQLGMFRLFGVLGQSQLHIIVLLRQIYIWELA